MASKCGCVRCPRHEHAHRERSKTEALKHHVWRRQLGRCAYCKKKPGEDQYDFDHVIPIAAGGKSTMENIQMLCRPCHRAKSRREQ